MVIGLFSSASDAASCLDNLAEADFDPHSISLVMRTPQEAEAIADVSGPLAGVSVQDLPAKLATLGLSRKDAQRYGQGVLKGGAFIAISAGSAEAAAAEMLGDARAQEIRVVKDRSAPVSK